ncbi:hypothetical protein LTR36_000603 [Oleoguttula mirabilis]|uniref:Cardiolipin synthase N-terminal domain-containing protein n=1 Tax=Oleoguttula mirabilis TaxID=1507867 RepID=A0AAV9JPV9_9PEZI|nr:hypothetical protein LTR36_000603 [Oleoguttula mirabilis]
MSLSLLLQLSLAALTLAAPVTTTGMNPSQSYGTGGGIVGFLILILDILVWIEVLKSNRPPSHKILWCLLVFILPLVGPVLYYIFSDRAKYTEGTGGYESIA